MVVKSSLVIINLSITKLAFIEKPEKFRRISPIYLTNKISSTLIIPIKMAEKYRLNEPNTHVILEETDDGILIKKLEV